MPINGEFIKSPDIYKKMKFAIICKNQSLANMIATPGKELPLKSVLSNIFVFFREKKNHTEMLKSQKLYVSNIIH